MEAALSSEGVRHVDLEVKCPALADLLSGGFNQDYEDIFGDAEDVIAVYTADPVFCARVPREVDQLVSTNEGAALDEALAALHNGYAYEAHGQTAREFLEMVTERALEQAVAPVAPYSELVGQQVSLVVEGPPVGVVVGDSVVDFTSGMRCSASGGRGLTDVDQARLAIGQPVLWVGESDGRISIATARVRMFTPGGPNSPEPSFEIRQSAEYGLLRTEADNL